MTKNNLQKDVSKFISSCNIQEIHDMYLVNLDLVDLMNTIIQNDKSDKTDVLNWVNGNTNKFPINNISLILDVLKNKTKDEKEDILYKALDDMCISFKEFMYLAFNPINFLEGRIIALELTKFFNGIDSQTYQIILKHVISVLSNYNSTCYKSMGGSKPSRTQLNAGDEIIVMENYTNYEIKVSGTINILDTNNIMMLANDIFGGSRVVFIDYDSVLEKI